MKYEAITEFDRDFKKLLKRFPTLADDLSVLKKHRIEFFHSNVVNLDDPIKIAGMCGDGYDSYKVRKIACKSLKNRGAMSGLRLIYVYMQKLDKIIFIEIYFKADKTNEDKERLKEFLETIK